MPAVARADHKQLKAEARPHITTSKRHVTTWAVCGIHRGLTGVVSHVWTPPFNSQAAAPHSHIVKGTLPPASFAPGSALSLRSIDAATHLPAMLQVDFYHVAWLFSAAA
jgi:hypothetical protein